MAKEENGTVATASNTENLLLATLRRLSKLIFTDNLMSWRLTLFSGIVFTLLSVYHTQVTMNVWGIYGFSFDDSWIHVQYARTIFEGRAWEYAWGIPSTGSSGPLWSIVLSPIFLFGYEHNTVVTSVLVISAILYALNVFLVGELVKTHTENFWIAIFAQLIFILVPRNAGLMLSGMETPLGMFILLVILVILPRKGWEYDLVLGVLAGLAYLCRPEFVLVAAICFPVRFLWMLKVDKSRVKRLGSLALMFALAVLVVTPWIIHCLNTTGLPLPDSYYSKLRWGVSDDGINLWNIFWFGYWFPGEPYLILGFVGGFILLLKRFPYEFLLTTSLWALYRLTMPGMSLLFAARYLVPLFTLIAISFVSGLFILLNRILTFKGQTKEKVSSERILIITLIVGLLFIPSLPYYQLYIDVHANQAKNIEEMQVTLAMWIHDNVPENATIATYDVGALGFFAKGRVLDMYGLVTPEILHNRTHAGAQLDYLREMNCTYIMYYVEWFVYYRSTFLSRGADVTELTRAHLDDNVVCGTDNMAVYRIDW